MAPVTCVNCQGARAIIIRPKNRQKLCKSCFITVFEQEVHDTIVANRLFYPGEKVAIGASGGKDSTVLASLMTTLNTRYDYGLDLLLLSVDEGIKGYRDDSLETVKRNATQYDLPLVIVGYDELYGWTMDQVVSQIGKKSNCTYCGVFRRQALDRGAARLSINHVVTGHNADDVAETVMMNLLRGDLPRLARATSIITSNGASDIKRSKPLKYAYEKEIVLYAHHKNLDYFTTECIYSPEAFRGTARALIKNLERIRPSAILDVVRSGEDMAKLASSSDAGQPHKQADQQTISTPNGTVEKHFQGYKDNVEARGLPGTANPSHLALRVKGDQPCAAKVAKVRPEAKTPSGIAAKGYKQEMRRCERCGYLTSQKLCKACLLLDILERSHAKTNVTV